MHPFSHITNSWLRKACCVIIYYDGLLFILNSVCPFVSMILYTMDLSLIFSQCLALAFYWLTTLSTWPISHIGLLHVLWTMVNGKKSCTVSFTNSYLNWGDIVNFSVYFSCFPRVYGLYSLLASKNTISHLYYLFKHWRWFFFFWLNKHWRWLLIRVSWFKFEDIPFESSNLCENTSFLDPQIKITVQLILL